MARFRLAAIQAAPVFLDLNATIDKACSLIEEAAKGGATLAVFPEAFVPAYPVWVWFIPAGQTHPLRAVYTDLHRNSITIPGPETDRLGETAARFGITVVLGVNEKNAEASNTSLFNTLLYIGPDGQILGKHRKFVPTTGERLVWARAADNDLQVFDLPFGRLSGLICWENYMPLARYALAAWGEQIHVAPTWDHGEPWTSTMRHIAKENRSVVVGCCQVLRKSDIPDTAAFKGDFLGSVEDWINPGGSVIVDPDGKLVAGPLEKEEGILYAEFEAAQLVGPRWQLDVAGHYSRPDLFELRVHRQARTMLDEVDELEGEEPSR